jgi:hypothetical protein
MKKLPIGIQTFRDIIEGDYCYVDKTSFIEKLNKGKYYFLSRPRRFGKSLFIDTLKEAFSGNKELFKGLYIYDKWDWDRRYPVIKISFGSGGFRTPEDLKIKLEEHLLSIKSQYKIDLTYPSVEGRFKEAIEKLYERYNEKVVVLIDEYDKPILDVIENVEVAKENREILKGFYGVLKDADPYLKLVFLTGVTRFSKVSIFSGLNQLRDITLSEEFSTICGYTQTDLETVFADRLKDFDVEEVKRWYNGYSWLGEKVYNPFDILLLFSEKLFRPYWFSTGTPTFLLKLIEKNRYYLPSLENVVKDDIILDSFDVEYIELETLMWQTGYLTIDEAYQSPMGMEYRLKIPNKEVSIALFGSIADFISKVEGQKLIKNGIYNSLSKADLNELENQLKSLYASIPYNNFTGVKLYEYEGYYASVFYAYLKSLGVEVIGEDVTNKGRIDLTLKMPNSIFIFEFKSDGGNALEQIKNKCYHEKYLCEGKDIYLVGIEFDVSWRNVSKVEWEKVRRLL